MERAALVVRGQVGAVRRGGGMVMMHTDYKRDSKREEGELLAREGRAAPSTQGGEQGHTRTGEWACVCSWVTMMMR